MFDSVLIHALKKVYDDLHLRVKRFLGWESTGEKESKQQREISKIQTYQDPTIVPAPSSGDDILITGFIRYSGVIVHGHLFDSGEIVVDSHLCPNCRNVLYHPESPTPSEVELDTVSEHEGSNHSNSDAIEQAKEEGNRLWILRCSSETCDYVRYDSYLDLTDKEYQIKSVFKKHFDKIKNNPKFDIATDIPTTVWEKYVYVADDEEVRSAEILLSFSERLSLRLRF